MNNYCQKCGDPGIVDLARDECLCAVCRIRETVTVETAQRQLAEDLLARIRQFEKETSLTPRGIAMGGLSSIRGVRVEVEL